MADRIHYRVMVTLQRVEDYDFDRQGYIDYGTAKRIVDIDSRVYEAYSDETIRRITNQMFMDAGKIFLDRWEAE